MSTRRAYRNRCAAAAAAAVLSGGLAVWWPGAPAAGPSADSKILSKIEAEAKAVGQDLASARKRAVTMAAALQRQERRLDELEYRLGALLRRQTRSKAELDDRHRNLQATLSALVRVARQPPQALLFEPGNADSTVRTSLILTNVVPSLERRATSLRTRLAALRSLQAHISRERADLARERDLHNEKRRELDAVIAALSNKHRQLTGRRKSEAERLKKLARTARDLNSFARRATRPSREAPMPVPAPRAKIRTAALSPRLLPPDTGTQDSAAALPRQASVTAVKGRLPLPVRGRIATRFGAENSIGQPSRGITLETRPSAAVVAPHDGTVMFSGPFRGYGQLLIIDIGENYHILLGGLARSDVVAGQWLLAGEPIGFMSEPSALGPGLTKPQLYIEFRHNGNPVNPLPWMAAGKRKVSG